jgi:DNA-nicking Smr family endonuclease
MRKQAIDIQRKLWVMDAHSRNVQRNHSERLHAKAAAIIFGNLNQRLLQFAQRKDISLANPAYAQVDLHYLFAKEALPRLVAVLLLANLKEWPHLVVICGRGKHSSSGNPRLFSLIKEELKRYAVERSVVEKVQCTDDGCILVKMRL